MCGIIGSFDRDKIIELCELNAYRGQASHSITYFDYAGPCAQKKALGPINYSDLIFPTTENLYAVVHLQAPTGDFYDKYIHPSDLDDDMLWHNGIVKQHEIKRLNEKYGFNYEWDTDLINGLICTQGIDVLSEIDGSFACLWYEGTSLYAFRNEIAPLFVDNDLNFSSTKFKDSSIIDPNQLFGIDLIGRHMNVADGMFETKQNPYYFG